MQADLTDFAFPFEDFLGFLRVRYPRSVNHYSSVARVLLSDPERYGPRSDWPPHVRKVWNRMGDFLRTLEPSPRLLEAPGGETVKQRGKRLAHLAMESLGLSGTAVCRLHLDGFDASRIGHEGAKSQIDAWIALRRRLVTQDRLALTLRVERAWVTSPYLFPGPQGRMLRLRRVKNRIQF